MLNEVTRIAGKPNVRLKSNIVPQQLQQEDPKMGNLHNAPIQPTQNDPIKPFIDLAGKDSHMRNDMISMLGMMYQQKRRDPTTPVKMPNTKTNLPEVELMYQKLFKAAENMSQQEMAVFAKKIQTAGLPSKNSTQPAQQIPPVQQPVTGTPPVQQAQQGNAVPATGTPVTGATTGSMSRLQGLLKQINPPLTDPQLRGVQHIVNQLKRKKP